MRNSTPLQKSQAVASSKITSSTSVQKSQTGRLFNLELFRLKPIFELVYVHYNHLSVPMSRASYCVFLGPIVIYQYNIGSCMGEMKIYNILKCTREGL